MTDFASLSKSEQLVTLAASVAGALKRQESAQSEVARCRSSLVWAEREARKTVDALVEAMLRLEAHLKVCVPVVGDPDPRNTVDVVPGPERAMHIRDVEAAGG